MARSKEWEEAEEGEEEEVDEPKKKKAKKSPVERPSHTEHLEPGAVVLYWDGWRGVIHDAFEALDSYWLADEESGQVIRDENEQIVAFKSADLKLVAPPPRLQEKNSFAPTVGVLLVGTAKHMMKVLEHFGAPDSTTRTEPQELLAVPCPMCDPSSLLKIAREGVNPTTVELAQKQRPDLHVALRAYHLRHAIEQCSPLLRLEDFFCLAGVTVPYSEEEIKACESKEEKRWRKTIANQLDLGVTAYGRPTDLEASTTAEVAQQTLGTGCGLCLSDVLWQEPVQEHIRKMLGIPELPLQFEDTMGASVFVVLLPEDASINEDDGILSFYECMGSEYASKQIREEEEEDNDEEEEQQVLLAAAREVGLAGGVAALGEKVEEKAQEKTVGDWEAEQEKFADQPKLPPNWIRIISRSMGKTYYFNKETQESSFEVPLPEGWTKQVSKSSGKTYYFHPGRKVSTFVRPTD